MDHTFAAQDLFAERYLLGELNADEAADFEEHLFDCAECAAAIRDGAAFMESGRTLVRTEQRFRRKGRVMTWLPSLVAAGLAIVVGVQNLVTIPALRMASQAPAIQAVPVVAIDQSRGAADQLHAGKRGIITFNIDSEQTFASYRCELRDAAGHPLHAETITSPQGVMLIGPLPAGSYTLVIEGVREDGNRTEIKRYPINVQGP